MKPIVTPLPAVNAPVVFDEWTYHDPEKQCDAREGCKKPQSESVDWVSLFDDFYLSKICSRHDFRELTLCILRY